MTLKDELQKLKVYIGTDEEKFNAQFEFIQKNFTSDEDKAAIECFIRDGLNELTADLKGFNEETNIKLRMQEVTEMISLSYIAKKYFNKTRQWLYQRVNGYNVNGKPARFTVPEIETLNFAMKDISQRIGSISIPAY